MGLGKEKEPEEVNPLVKSLVELRREITIYTIASGIVEAAVSYDDSIENIAKDIDTVLEAVKPKKEK